MPAHNADQAGNVTITFTKGEWQELENGLASITANNASALATAIDTDQVPQLRQLQVVENDLSALDKLLGVSALKEDC